MSTKIFIQSIIHLLLLTSFESSSFTTDCKIGTHAIYRDMIRKGIRSILYYHSNHSSHIAGGKKYSLRTRTGLLLRTFSKAISLIGGLGNIVLHAAVGAGEVIIQGQAVKRSSRHANKKQFDSKDIYTARLVWTLQSTATGLGGRVPGRWYEFPVRRCSFFVSVLILFSDCLEFRFFFCESQKLTK